MRFIHGTALDVSRLQGELVTGTITGEEARVILFALFGTPPDSLSNARIQTCEPGVNSAHEWCDGGNCSECGDHVFHTSSSNWTTL